jgi:hypothetical protein
MPRVAQTRFVRRRPQHAIVWLRGHDVPVDLVLRAHSVVDSVRKACGSEFWVP